MSALLISHLEQIASCANSISELPFPGPKAFTNAIVSTPDITSLIRDTELHERALYQLAPSEPQIENLSTSYGATPATTSRRVTAYRSRQPKNKAVATVLGSELYEQLQHQSRGDVDVELLLHGAKKLASVYPVPGALERIAKLQQRAQQLETNIAHYETRVAEQRTELEKMQTPTTGPDSAEVYSTTTSSNDHMSNIPDVAEPAEDPTIMQSDIEQLEQRRKALENRVTGMDRDLSALAR